MYTWRLYKPRTWLRWLIGCQPNHKSQIANRTNRSLNFFGYLHGIWNDSQFSRAYNCSGNYTTAVGAKNWQKFSKKYIDPPKSDETLISFRKLITMESLDCTTCLINPWIKKDFSLGEDNYETIFKMRQYYSLTANKKIIRARKK